MASRGSIFDRVKDNDKQPKRQSLTFTDVEVPAVSAPKSFTTAPAANTPKPSTVSTPKVESNYETWMRSSKERMRDTAKQLTELENRRKKLKDDYLQTQARFVESSNPEDLKQLRAIETEMDAVKVQLEDLEKLRPTYNARNAEKMYGDYEAEEKKVKEKHGSVEKLVADLDSRAAKLSEQEQRLKELEAQLKVNPSEHTYQTYLRTYDTYTRSVAEYQKLYADYEPVQRAWQDYDAYDKASKSDVGFGEGVKRVVNAGITQTGSLLASTLALPDKLLSKAMPGVATPLADFAAWMKEGADRDAALVQEAVHGKKGWGQAANVGVATVAAIPQMLAALLSSGISTAATGATLATGAGAPVSMTTSLMNAAKQALKNPSYIASMASTLGSDFDEAKAAGATDIEALATAVIASSVNAGIEIGGGLEAVDDSLPLVQRILKSGREEGWEEVLQGIVSGTVNKGIYDFDKPIASLTDPDAILNPQRMAEEAFTGAAVGMLLTGTTSGLAAAANKLTGPRATHTRTDHDPVSPAAAPEVQQAQAQAEVVQAQNPEAEVLDAATTLFTQQGMNLKTAQKRAEIVGKLVRGEEVSDKDLNRIDPTSNQTKQIFTQLTGVQFPEGKIQIEKLRDLYRSAHPVAEAAKTAEQQALERANVMTAQYNRTPVTQLFDEQILERAKQARVAANPEAEAQAAQILAQARGEIAPDGTALLSYKDFSARHKQVFPDASPQETARMYDLYLRDNQTIGFMGRRMTRRQVLDTLNSAPDSDKMTPEERAAVEARLNELFDAELEQQRQDGKDATEHSVRNKEANNGKRESGQSPVQHDGQSGQPGERTGMAAAGLDQGARSQEGAGSQGNGADARGYGEVSRGPVNPDAVSADGETNFMEIHEEAWSDEMRAQTPKFKRAGITLRSALGPIPIPGTTRACDGVSHLGVESIVQSDSPFFSFEQLCDHEVGHQYFFRDPALYQKCAREFRLRTSKSQRAELMKSYLGSYADVYAQKTAKEQAKIQAAITEEIICDAYAGMNRSGANADQLQEFIQPIIDDWCTVRDAELESAEKRYSIDSMAEAVGLTFEKDGQMTVFKDGSGNRVDKVTEKMVQTSPLGAVIQSAVDKKFITDADAAKQITFFTELYNLMLKTQDIDLLWAVSSSIGFQPIEAGPRDPASLNQKSKFAGYTKNSDPQYSTTVDFTTICLKTQAVIDAMSATMMELGHGLTEDEIVNIVYRNTHKAGEPVPCPVCYVFSRWVGLGGLFDNMNNLQTQYANADLEMLRADIETLSQRIDEIMVKRGYALATGKGGSKSYVLPNSSTKKSFGDAKIVMEKELMARQLELQAKQNQDMVSGKKTMTKAEEAELAALKRDIQILDNWTWLTDVRLSENYAPVPPEILFDINAGKEFAERYPESWKFRTTRGPAMGKAATPYADEHLGQILRGAGASDLKKAELGDPAKNPFLKSKNGKLTPAAEKALQKSIAKIKAQNLLNGQRYQSTSDFRFEYALDYLLSFVEMQALGGKVQLYTKVAEAVRMFASIGAEVNCSLMPLGIGYRVNKDGSKTLIFSSVTGMNAEDAFNLSNEFDNVQPIMVGIGNEHIRLCMADDRITFIIPYHASGAGEARYVALMDIVGEHVEEREDYSNYQTDHKIENPTKSQKAAYELRLKLLTGKLGILSDADKQVLRDNEILHNLYKRFYGKDMDGNISDIDPKYLNPETRNSGKLFRDNECYGAFLTKDQAKNVMPFEYWDRTSTIDQADLNGQAFVEYCESLGLRPRFSGWDGNGVYHAEFDFSKESGYWKMLIDRSVYNRDGSYHEQQAINVTNFNAGFLLREESVKGIVQPSLVNDPAKTEKIAQKSADQVREKRAEKKYSITPAFEQWYKETYGTELTSAQLKRRLKTAERRAAEAEHDKKAAELKNTIDSEMDLTAWMIHHTKKMREQKRASDAKLDAARKAKTEAVRAAVAETKEIERAKAEVQHDADRMAERRNAAKRLRTQENAYTNKVTELKENAKLKRNAAKATLRDSRLAAKKRAAIETEQGLVDTIRKNPKQRTGVEKLQDAAQQLRTLGRSAYRNFVNMAESIDRFSKRQVSDMRAGTLVNILGGSASTMETVFKKGLVDRAGNRIGESMSDVFLCWDEAHKKVNEGQQALLQDFMLHWHNIDRMSIVARAESALETFELNHEWLRDMDQKEFARLVAMTEKEVEKLGKHEAQQQAFEYVRLIRAYNEAQNKPIFADDKGNSVTAETSQRIVDQYLEEHPWLLDKANGIYEWWDLFMRNWAVGDTISEAEYNRMRQMYPHYVPTYRADKNGVGGAGFVGAGGATVSKAVKKAKGSHSEVMNIEDSFSNIVSKIIRLNRLNELYMNIIDTAMLDEDGTFADMAYFDWDWQDGAYANALITGSADIADLTDTVEETEKAGLEKVGSDYKLSGWLNGRKYTAYISEDLYKSIGMVTGHLANDLEQNLLKAGNALTKFMKSAITGYNPTFAIRNLSRDLPTAIVNSISGLNFPKYYAQAAKEIAKNSDHWKTFQALGGTHATYYNDNKGFAADMMPRNLVEKAFSTLGAFNEITEAQTRFAEYLATVDKLGDTYEARLQGIKNAAEVTVDFSRKGRYGKVINAWVPYWNPAVQGIDKTVRSVIDSPDGSAVWKQASKTLGRAAMTTVLFEAILFGVLKALDRDDEWEELNDRTKDTYYCIPLKDSNRFLKIPKNREWGAILGTPFMRMLEWANGREDPFENYIETAIEPNFLPPAIFRPDSGGGFASDIIGISQALDLAKNEDFAGRTIVPNAYQQGTLSQQFDNETSALAKKLGELFNWSPMQIDYIIGDYFGDFGDMFINATSEATRNGEQNIGEAALKIVTNPFFADARYSNASVSKYYDLVDDLGRVVQDKKNQMGNDAAKETLEYQTEKAIDEMYGKQISELNRIVRELPDGTEKDNAKAQIAQLTKEAIEFYHDSMAGKVSNPIRTAEYSDFSESVSKELIRMDSYSGDYKFTPTGNPSAKYTDPSDKTREYILDDEQKDYFKQLYREKYDEIFSRVIQSSKYKNAKDAAKAELLEDTRDDVLDATKEEFFDWLKASGVRSTKKQK